MHGMKGMPKEEKKEDVNEEVLAEKLKEEIARKEEQLERNKKAHEIQKKITELNLRLQKIIANNPRKINPTFEVENDAEALAIRKEATLLEIERSKILFEQEEKDWNNRYANLVEDLEYDKKRLAELEGGKK